METEHVYKQTRYLRKLHPLWIGFKLFKSIKSLIAFILFLFIILDISSNSLFSIYGISLIALFVIYQVGTTILEWKRFGYYLNQKELFVQKGQFVMMKRYFPLENIQGINQNTSFIHRILGLTSLLIDVGSSDNNSSVKLEMISLKEADNIKKTLSKYSNIHLNDQVKKEVKEEELKTNSKKRASFTEKNHYEIKLSEILIASLTSLRLLFFLSVLYSIYSQLSEFLSIEEYINKALIFFRHSAEMMILGVILLIVSSMAYGLLKTYIQYGGLKVTSDSYRIYIEKGIGSKTSFSIPKDKIQALNINSGFIHKMLSIVNVKLISSTDIKDEDVKASNILFPFINNKKVIKLITEVLPSFEITRSITKIPKRSLYVKLLRSMYIWLLLPVSIVLFFPGFWYIALLIFIITITSQMLSGLFSGYSLNGPFLQLKKIAITNRMFIMRKDKIERIMITETMIQRKLGLSSLKVTTRARPAKVITMHDIPIQIAHKCQRWFVEEVENP